jgi:glycyl-tRNA synthetase
MDALIKKKGIKSPEGNPLGDVRQFNMMFKTQVGAIDDASATVYLRPETAGGIFVNFKNVVDTIHPKLPFGIAQIGKAFRNEIAPRDFIFRLRELEQMEVEYFVRPSEWEKYFDEWQKQQLEFADAIGLDKNRIHQVEIPEADRAHYSKRSIDTEFDFPFGQKELWGFRPLCAREGRLGRTFHERRRRPACNRAACRRAVIWRRPHHPRYPHERIYGR